jgi:pimeloyl-ACP methyl ester carboxylesterase
MSKTVLLIHGAWLTPASWQGFRKRFEAKGYKVVAPPWPLEDVPIQELRRNPHPDLRKMTVTKIVDHYDKLIRALPESPIIIGHSFGGVFTELLLDRGLGVAGVAIDPAPIRGVFPPPRMLLSALPIFLAWMGWNRVLTMSYHAFATTFAQTLPEAKKKPAYDRYIVPTPGRIFYQGAFGIGTSINANNPNRAPLLLITGEEDITVTPPSVQVAYNKQRKAPSLTELKMFPGRSHFLCIEPGWEEVADYALAWASKNARKRAN